MKRFQAKRLLKLAAKLRDVPREQFKMSNWTCGTAACALGWACYIPEFNRLGLSLNRDKVPEFIPKTVTDREWVERNPLFAKKGLFAGQLFFGLDDDDAQTLFFGRNCTPKEAAERVEGVVKRYFPELLGAKRC